MSISVWLHWFLDTISSKHQACVFQKIYDYKVTKFQITNGQQNPVMILLTTGLIVTITFLDMH